MRCEEIMAQDVRMIAPEDTVQTAASIMRDANIGFLPVCDQASGRVVGTLTDRDVAVRVVAEGHPATVQVGLVMTREVVTCTADEDLSTVAQRMGTAKKSRLVVIDESGRPIGVISLSDLAETDPQRAIEALGAVTEREAKASERRAA